MVVMTETQRPNVMKTVISFNLHYFAIRLTLYGVFVRRHFHSPQTCTPIDIRESNHVSILV